MGKVYSHIAFRISRNLNVENRAHKLISQEKIRPPPKLKSTEEYLEKLRHEQPEFGEEITKKDDELLKRLENVYVTSKDPAAAGDGRRAAGLPVDRTPATLARFGYPEPARVPYGRVTLRAAVGFLMQHSEQPHTHTAEAIARQQKLDPNTVAEILEHFHLMRLHMPTTDTGQIRPMDWISQEPVSELMPWEIPQLQKAEDGAAGETPPQTAGPAASGADERGQTGPGAEPGGGGADDRGQTGPGAEPGGGGADDRGQTGPGAEPGGGGADDRGQTGPGARRPPPAPQSPS